MSASKFKFVSPGVFVKEIDNSQLPALPRDVGPVIIGRASKGPAMLPVQINSPSSFVETFGDPIFGCGSSDQWRSGPSDSAPSYGTYAAMAYLANRSPLIYVRLAGVESTSATTANGGKAGWQSTGEQFTTSTDLDGGAFGLFLVASGSDLSALGTGSLGAIFYASTGSVVLSGTLVHTSGTTAQNTDMGTAGLFQSQFAGSGFTACVLDGDGTVQEKIPFNFIESSEDFIRKQFNTSPSLINTSLKVNSGADRKTYFLGESFTKSVLDNVGSSQGVGETYGVILGLDSGSVAQHIQRTPLTTAKTGWFIGQDLGAAASFNALAAQKLFRLVGLGGGHWNQSNLKISITSLSPSSNPLVPYGTFSIEVRQIAATDDGPAGAVEVFSQLSLNPNSANYIVRKIGDKYREWDATKSRYQEYGEYANLSRYVRVEVQDVVRDGTVDAAYLPFGVLGPKRFKGFTIASGSESALVSGKPEGFPDAFVEGGSVVASSLANANEFIVPGMLDSPTHATATFSGIYTASIGAASTPTDVTGVDYVTLTASAGSPMFQFTASAMASPGEGQFYTGSDGAACGANIAAIINVSCSAAFSPDGKAHFSAVSASTGLTITSLTAPLVDGNNAILSHSLDSAGVSPARGVATNFSGAVSGTLSASFNWPAVPLRSATNAPTPGTDESNAYFGAQTVKGAGFFASVTDIVRRLPGNLNDADPASTPTIEYSWAFTLDDIVSGSNADPSYPLGVYTSGSRQEGTSYTAVANDSKAVLDAGIKRFTTVLNGGFDGMDILEVAPFRNTLLDANPSAETNYAFESVERAIATVADAEIVECNLMTMPGLTNNVLTKKLIDVCAARGDALGIIDLDGGYIPPTEDKSASPSTRNGSLQTVINNLTQRQINNSYGCAYYPWVQITDNYNTGGSLTVPPSVVALGTFAYSEEKAKLWFAPAGFTRGGLSANGAAGLPVTNVTQRLNQKERDNLYEVGINPIASFPAEGIVIYGQKTLQITPSALDRINVRRLMIYVKREISTIAATLLFDQNVSSTWARFLGRVNPFLLSVQTGLGLTAFKVVLDQSTTTADLIDRNIMYAKIFLQPARSIEFIALDFIITRTGASFED